MKKIIAMLVVISLIMSFVSVNTYAQINIPEYIRVGLFYGSTAKQNVSLSADNVVVYCEGVPYATVPAVNVTIAPDGFLVNDVLYQAKVLEFVPVSGIINVNSKPYRGYVKLILTAEGITVINIAKLEEYLRGVLPLEMATGWPIEALKAQALCARTYAVSDIGRFEQYGFDVTDTTLSQVYGGVNVEKADCTRAVEETAGMVVTYNGKLAETYYFSTSSGVTLDVKDVWTSAIPYLVPVDDSLQSNVIKDNGAWKVTYSKQELEELLIKKGVDLGEINSVTVDEYNAQGAVMKLTFKGTKGSKTYTKGKTRDILSLRSQVYTINTLSKTPTSLVTMSIIDKEGVENVSSSLNVLSSQGLMPLGGVFSIMGNNEVVNTPENTPQIFDGIEINGTGYGHGIGMSQNGAKALARAGYTAYQIITHYYTGVQVTGVNQEG